MDGSMSLVPRAAAWCEWALDLALCAGSMAGLLAMVVLAINILFRRWFSARQMSFLWGLVLLRLLLPVAPSSALSLQNLFVGEPVSVEVAGDVSPQPDRDART